MKNERMQLRIRISTVCLRTCVNEWRMRACKWTREVSIDALRLDIFMSYQSIFVGIILFSFLMSKQRETWQECEIGSKYDDDDDDEEVRHTYNFIFEFVFVYKKECVYTHSACVYRYLENVCFYCWLTQTHMHTHTQNNKIDESNCTGKRSWNVMCANQCCGYQRNGGSIVIALNGVVVIVVVLVVVMVVVRFDIAITNSIYTWIWKFL